MASDASYQDLVFSEVRHKEMYCLNGGRKIKKKDKAKTTLFLPHPARKYSLRNGFADLCL